MSANPSSSFSLGDRVCLSQPGIYQSQLKALSEFWVTVTDKIESDWICDMLGVPRERIIPKIWFSKRAMLVSHKAGRFDLVIQADFLGPNSCCVELSKIPVGTFLSGYLPAQVYRLEHLARPSALHTPTYDSLRCIWISYQMTKASK